MTDATPFLTLGLGDELFGIDIRQVREILDVRPIARLPHAPDFLLGMIDVRGAGYPVVDLRTKLGLPRLEPTATTRIIILDIPVNGRVQSVGFMADRVLEVAVLEETSMMPAPEVGGRWRSTYIASIARRDDAFVIIFDLNRLMAGEDLAFLPKTARDGSMSAPIPELKTADKLADRHFAAIVSVVEGHVGIKLPPAKRIMVEGRLRKRVRALGLDSLQAYGAYLFDKGGLEAEFVHLIDCVTTNKTDFFREPSHFDFMRTVAVPALLQGTRGSQRRIKVWSAACSTGAEAFTIAMVLQDMNEQGLDFRYSILGTDVSTEILAEAQAAIYRRDFVASVPAPMQQRYLMQSRDSRSDLVRIIPELRSWCISPIST